MMMKTRHNILLIPLLVLMALLMVACSSDNDVATDDTKPLPEGMGRIRITISTPEANPDLTRAVGSPAWEDPDHSWEWLHSFRILIFDSTYKLVDIIERTEPTMTASTPDPSYKQSATVESDALTAGTYYYIYATANYADGFVEGTQYTEDDITNATAKFSNGYSETNIPMTGKLTKSDGSLKAVDVSAGSTADAGTITVWRVMAKMQFEFINESTEQIEILGVEVEPINLASDDGPGIYLFSQDDLESAKNLAAPNFNQTVNKTRITTTWTLQDDVQQEATVSDAGTGLFSQAQLMWGSLLQSKGRILAGAEADADANKTKLQAFTATEEVEASDDRAAIILSVKPKDGLTFTPTGLSFKACRGATDEGNIRVVSICNGTSTEVQPGVRPSRYNGKNDGENPTYYSTYSYDLTNSATPGVFTVKIYLSGVPKDKWYAFSDFVITGNVKNIDDENATWKRVTLPPAPSGENKKSGREDVGKVKYPLTTSDTPLLTLNGYSGTGTKPTGTLFFYVNETDATFTNTENQLSLRFKIKRGGTISELRYGVTTPYIDGHTGGDGFNVIRRNDWIHIPIVLTDWQLRIEPLAFVPIAGYPATLLSSDALTATFGTGGMIALQPFIKKKDDPTWRDFGDSEVTLVSIHWKNSDGTDVFGDGKIVKTAFAYDDVTKCIIGELNQAKVGSNAKTTFTVNLKLGSSPQYDYTFTFNIILQ